MRKIKWHLETAYLVSVFAGLAVLDVVVRPKRAIDRVKRGGRLIQMPMFVGPGARRA
jgi:hypothetical protein